MKFLKDPTLFYKFPIKELALLLLFNILFFHKQYFFSGYTFPFDFLYSYFYVTYYWLESVSWSHFPLWNPYASLGYPEHLSLQSGGFYPPLLLFKLFNIPYTLYAATVFHCLHLFFGSVGCYLLARQFQLRNIISLAVAIAYISSVGMFASAQHTDIVRGYCLIPWILFFLDPAYLKRIVGILGVVFFGFCLLSGAYPGIVIASAYLIPIYACGLVIGIDSLKGKLLYLAKCCLLGLVIALLAMPKYLTFVLLTNELILPDANSDFGRASLANLLTLLFPYTSESMKTDPSMRGLYVAPFFLVLAGSGIVWRIMKRRDLQPRLAPWVCLLVGAVILLFNSPLSQWIFENAPLLSSSRFSLAALRPFLHLALVMLGGYFLQQVCLVNSKQIIILLLPGVVFYVGIFYYGVTSDFFDGADLDQGKLQFILLLLSLLILMLGKFRQERYYPILLILPLVTNLTYAFYTPHLAAWTIDRAYYRMQKFSKFDHQEFFAKSRTWKRVWEQRPARLSGGPIMFGNGNSDMITQNFSTNGYNSGTKIIKIMKILGVDLYPGIPDLTKYPLNFLVLPGIAIPLASTQELHACLAEQNCQSKPHLKQINFMENSALFAVDLPEESIVVENEIYYPGWKARITGGVNEEILAQPFDGLLRSWKLPAGQYQLQTYYDPPGWRLAKYLAGLGAGLLLLIIFSHYRGRKN